MLDAQAYACYASSMFMVEDYWVVRCPPARTLHLAKMLEELCFDVWTPVAEREYRKARSKKFIRVSEAMLSSFIFVKMGSNPLQCAARLDDLRSQYAIRVWRSNGKYAPVKTAELEGLRALEREASAAGIDNLVKDDQFDIGQEGEINAPAFTGLRCTLISRSRGKLLVLIDGSTIPIIIKPSVFVPCQK